MKEKLCMGGLVVLGASIAFIHTLMIKRAIQLEEKCGCLCHCDCVDSEAC